MLRQRTLRAARLARKLSLSFPAVPASSAAAWRRPRPSRRCASAPSPRRGVVVLLAAEPLGRRTQTSADALGLAASRLRPSRPRLPPSPWVELAADELDLRDLGRVAPAEAEAQQARVAAGPRLRSAARACRTASSTTSRSCRSCMTRRRACSVLPLACPSGRRPRLATVMSRSTNGRSSFARGTVVVRCSWRSRAVAWFRSIAMRCSVTRPSFRCATRCLMALLLGRSARRGRSGRSERTHLPCLTSPSPP